MTTQVRMAPGKISPKAVLAFLFPTVGTLLLVAVQEGLSPHLDSTLRVAIVGVVNSLLALAGAYVGAPAKDPGDIVPLPATAPPVGKRLGETGGLTEFQVLIVCGIIAAAVAIIVVLLFAK